MSCFNGFRAKLNNLIYTKGSYSNTLYIFGILLSILFLIILIYQCISIKNGYDFCSSEITFLYSSVFGNEITISCSYSIFVIPIVFEIVIIFLFWLNPFVGCSYMAKIKPFLNKSNDNQRLPIIIEDDSEQI